MERPYWEEEEEAVEVGLRGRHESSRRQEKQETSATTTVNGKDTTTIANGIESTDVFTGHINTVPEFICKTEILTALPTPRSPLETSLPKQDIQVNSSHINGTASNGSITTLQESRQHHTDMYLDTAFPKQATQEFFCPNCNTCIRKVVLRDSDWQFVTSPPPVAPEPAPIPRDPVETFRCTSCFSFLIPVGSWFHTLIRVKKDDEREEESDPLLLDHEHGALTSTTPEVDRKKNDEKEPPSQTHDDQNKKGSETNKDRSMPFVRIEGELVSEADEQNEDDRVDKARPKQEFPPLEEVVIDGKPSMEKKKTGANLSLITKISEKEETEKRGKGPVERELPKGTPTVAGPSASSEAEASTESGGGDKWEILKSIVYGGLAESITSLSVVTSAAAANVGSLQIIAMALANLIGGLFIIVHNIWDVKAEQHTRISNETNEQVDRYQELLGQRKNFALHATLVLLSFLVFGLEPPVVYSFSFRESDNRDYKLAVVAGASFLCISLLAIGKAHIQKPSSYHAYVKTLMYYLVIGFAASGVSYVAGDLIEKLVEKFGWFKSESDAAIFLPFNDARAVNPTWSSY